MNLRNKMNQVYRAMGISKHGFHQKMDRYLEMLEEGEQLVPVIVDFRFGLQYNS